MSLWPARNFVSDPTPSFAPLFRLLDEYGDYNAWADRPLTRRGGTAARTITPRFDVKENPDSYELHGELPGIEQKDVDIEFTDYNTINVKGRTERSYQEGQPPTAEGKQVAKQEGGNAAEQGRWWVSERSVGEFSRTFSFPERVDQDNVRATMKNGILSVIVPKTSRQETRRKITIS